MRLIPFYMLTVLSIALIGCQQTYIPESPQLAFTGSPYILNVETLNIIDDFQSSKTPPHVELLSDISPADGIKQWAAAKLLARGSSGYAELVVRDAHIIKKDIPKEKSGLEGYFTNEQTEQYNGLVEVEIKIYDGKKILPVASIHVSAQNARTLAENATIEDHKKLYHEMSVELVKLLVKQLDQNIQEHLNNYLM